MNTNDISEKAMIIEAEKAMMIKEQSKAIEEWRRNTEERLAKLEQWMKEWKEVFTLLAELTEEAEKRHARLAFKEVIDPYAEDTTVEQLLHMLESECPATTVIDALSKKAPTFKEKRRLVSNLYYIANKCIDAIKEINVFADDEDPDEKATQEQETIVQDVQTS